MEYPVPRARRHCSVKFRSHRTIKERYAAQLFEWSLGGLDARLIITCNRHDESILSGDMRNQKRKEPALVPRKNCSGYRLARRD